MSGLKMLERQCPSCGRTIIIEAFLRAWVNETGNHATCLRLGVYGLDREPSDDIWRLTKPGLLYWVDRALKADGFNIWNAVGNGPKSLTQNHKPKVSLRPPAAPRSFRTDDKQTASVVYPHLPTGTMEDRSGLADVIFTEDGMDIGPGDFVECVDANPSPGTIFGPTEALRLGALYTVERCMLIDGTPCVHLVEIKRDARAILFYGENCGYATRRFRPIYRPKPNAFDQYLKAPDKTKIPA